MSELERISQAEVYINRYFEFADAVDISNQNREYLKTYLHDDAYVTKQFNINSQITKSLAICAGAAAAAFLLFFLILGVNLIIVPIIAAAFVLVLGAVFVVCLHKYRLSAALAHQKEVNEGINEQIVILEDRTKQLERQRDDYLKALGKKIDFMELDIDYMKNISVIKGYVEDGSAETCEDAVDIYEQNMLMQQMTSIMTQSEAKPVSHEENMERFGDPLKIIKENKKKRRKEKKEKKSK
jgi:hypothetical protein